jgi:hypothetical protein
LQVEVTLEQEAVAAVEASRAVVVLAAETSAQEAAAAWGSAVILVKDVEDRAALVEREARERVLGGEAESTAALAPTCEEAEGLVLKFTLLEGELAEAC